MSLVLVSMRGSQSEGEILGRDEMAGVPVSTDLAALAARLSAGGFLAAEEEAGELLARAAGDAGLLDAMVARRFTGEPLAWITGSTSLCDLLIRVDEGVYVPRWQSEPLARRAAERLPATGIAVTTVLSEMNVSAAPPTVSVW